MATSAHVTVAHRDVSPEELLEPLTWQGEYDIYTSWNNLRYVVLCMLYQVE